MIYFFRQITTFRKVCMAFVIMLQSSDPLIDIKPKNKDLTNFYECCDLTKKVYLVLPHRQKEIPESQQNVISSTSEISLYCDFLGLQIGSTWAKILKIGSV